MYDYSYYGASASDAAIVNGLAGFLATYSLIMLVILVVELIGLWKTFTKAGQAGWKCIIPIYNLVTLYKIAGISPWLILCYLLSWIPVIGWLIVLILNIYFVVNLSKSYGHGGGFAVGLFFLQPIFICILGFGNSEYKGKVEATTTE